MALRIRGSVCVRKPLLSARTVRPARNVAANGFAVRPYTVRGGDTLTSIARKRGFELSELMKLNHDIDPDNLKEGQTIILPLGSLSERDKEMIKGMDRGKYRVYPLRKGESLEDVLSKRKITMVEFLKLNPELDINNMAETEIVKLPASKFTVREQAMLRSAGAPSAFFGGDNAMPFVIGVVAGVGAFGAVQWAINKAKDDDEQMRLLVPRESCRDCSACNAQSTSCDSAAPALDVLCPACPV
eukprot:TRINITY_DN13659_c0_g1_i3.p2 TRINITY_DN13659_c0_g1~~TRINITY_DN13659_c0_g1_i3.p2  ORF type:complete len:243 (+),score=26.35 TRINITY_DN13659_c0_g1_i3:200-928(+)